MNNNIRMLRNAGIIKEAAEKVESITNIGEKRVIDKLNELLARELTVISQYMVHAEMCANWGYNKLAGQIKMQAIGEMKHAEKLIERIIFFNGVPDIKLNEVYIGTDVPSMLDNDKNAEAEAVDLYNDSVKICRDDGDNGTRDMLEFILKDEEAHLDWLLSLIDQIDQMGLENFLANQV